MELFLGVFTAFGLSASAGLNAYIPLLVIALLGRFTNLIQLTPPWDTLESGWVIGFLVLLSLIEFFADKIPAVNHINDLIQTLVRPAAGAITFAASANVISDVNPVFSMVLGILVAGSVHAVKAVAIRPAVTAATGGTANIPVSVAEDLLSTILSLISTLLPILIAVLMLLLSFFLFWLVARRRRVVRRI